MLNQGNFMGYVIGDPVLKHTASGHTVCTFTLLVGRPKPKDKPDAPEPKPDFFRVVTFGNRAEFCAGKLVDRCLVFVSGRVHIEEYEVSSIVYTTAEIQPDIIRFLAPPKDRSAVNQTTAETAGTTPAKSVKPTYQREKTKAATSKIIDSIEEYDEDLPF